MSMIDNVKNIGAIVAAITIGYGVVLKAGWVIGRAEATTMIELAVQQATAQTNSALLDEAKSRQIADLNFQLEMVNQQIEALLEIEDRDEKEEYQLEQFKKRVDQINSQIAGLNQ